MLKKLTFFVAALALMLTCQNVWAQIDNETPIPDDPGYSGGNGNYYVYNDLTGHNNDFVFWDGDNATGSIFWGDATFISSTNQVDFTAFMNYFYQGQQVLPNDKARSLSIQGAPAGKTIEVYNSPSGSTDQDWCEIIVKQTLPSNMKYVVNTFEKSTEDQYVKMIYHSVNGDLDGKVSFYKVY